MSEILVFGHKSPDTDSICSSIVMADLEQYLGIDTAIACRLGEINKETKYGTKNIPHARIILETKLLIGFFVSPDITIFPKSIAASKIKIIGTPIHIILSNVLTNNITDKIPEFSHAAAIKKFINFTSSYNITPKYNYNITININNKKDI